MTFTEPKTAHSRQSGGARRFLFLILAAFAAATVTLVATRWVGAEDLTTQSSAVITPVDAVAVQPVESITAERYFTGRVAARRSSPLAFERSARIDSVLVDKGDRVQPGQPLAWLDNRDLELRKAQLEANRAQAQARLDELISGPRQETIAAARAQLNDLQQQLELSQVQTKRRQELLDRQAISREEFDRLDFQSRSLEASLAAARARLDELMAGTRTEQLLAQRGVVAEIDSRIASVALDLDKSVLRAPYAGRINERLLDEGAFASPGRTVLTMLEEARPEARIGLPADAAQRLAPGERRTIEIAGAQYRATLTGLLPELEAETRTVTALFELETPKRDAIFPGQIARLAVTREEPVAGYWLPLEALSRGVRGLWACYAVVETGEIGVQTIERRQVEVLSTQGDRALVRGAIAPGDLVVRNGANRVTAGQRVRTRS
jgi:multidrug resistance efflux pump